MGRKIMARKNIMFSLMILVIILSHTTSAQSDVLEFQDQGSFSENRVLSFDRPTLYMFGEQRNSEPYANWPTWNHANNVDEGNSDNYFTEAGLPEPGNPNNGGGAREFTFRACVDSSCNPNNESIQLIEGEYITGSLILKIGCNSGNCRTDVTVTLSLNGNDLQSIYMDSGNAEGNSDKYEFIFDQAKFTDDLIPIGAEFDVRVSFQKPGGALDFYELYLQDEFTITFPIMPEIVYPIPESDFEPNEGVWKSPYSASGSGFTSQEVQSVGIVIPIILFVLSTIFIVVISVITPPLNWAKIPGVLLLIFSLIIPVLVAPILSYVEVNKFQNTDSSPNLYSVSDLIGMQTQKGSFIGDLLPEDNFNLWIDNSYIFSNSLKNNTNEPQNVYGLGFENYEDIIASDMDSSKHGRMILQLYFSILEINPSEGSGILINITLVNDTMTNQIVPDFALKSSGNMVFLNEGNPRWVVPQEAITIIGTQVNWKFYPLLGLLPSVGLLSYGIYHEIKKYKSDDNDYNFE